MLLTYIIKSDNMKSEVAKVFTHIKLKNFMSFKNVVFDLKNGNKGAKNFISVYGENGSGKSNFVSSINLLRRSIDSFQMLVNTEKIRELAQEKELPEGLLEIVMGNTNIWKLTDSCRMVDCDEETSMEYGFQIGKYEGYYVLSFEEKFVYEKLYYFTGKQRGTLFEIKFDKGKIATIFSNKLFTNKKVEEEIRDEIDKYWGKHTFLSILNKERNEKNKQYIDDNYLKYVFDILNMLQEITIHYKKTSYSGSEVRAGKPNNILHSLDVGKVQTKFEPILNRSERILKDFFTQAYADIKDIFYERMYEEKEISYKLCVKKMIGGKIRTIDFKNESAGTQHILEIIHSLLGAFCGITVVYDEIDDGIHDLLLKNILESMMDDISGQLIITTHNTYLLESIDIKSVYLITVDYQGNKEVKCLDKYPRIQGTNNPRIMYLKGLFGGVPIVDSFDYDLILNELQTDDIGVEGGE